MCVLGSRTLNEYDDDDDDDDEKNRTNVDSMFDNKQLNDFIVKYDLVFTDDHIDCDTQYTFEHKSMNYCSKIDYFLISRSNINVVLDYHVIDSGLNLSDHLPIAIVLNQQSPEDIEIRVNNDDTAPFPAYFRWDHGDKNLYYNLTRDSLQSLLYRLDQFIAEISRNEHNVEKIYSEIEYTYESLALSISESAQISIPKIKADSLKFWWDDTLDDLKNNSVNSFRLWKSVGKPRNGPIFEEMSRHRLLYRNQIRANKNSSLIQISNDLHDALLKKDSNSFWKCWKNKCCNKSKDPMTVNGLTNNQEIVNEFANHFQNLSKPLQKSKFHDFIDESNYSLNGKLESSNYCIDIETVDRLVKSSKTGKAAGSRWAHC